MKAANHMKTSRADAVVVLEASDSKNAEFWGKLSLSTTPVEVVDNRVSVALPMCYKLEVDDDTPRFDEQCQPGLMTNDPEPCYEDKFVVDAGDELFVWISESTAKDGTVETWQVIEAYFENTKRDVRLPVTRMVGSGTASFRVRFAVWNPNDHEDTQPNPRLYSCKKTPATEDNTSSVGLSCHRLSTSNRVIC